MIIFMSGYPYAGKSFIVNLIAEGLGDKECLVVSPKSFRDETYESLNEEEKREMNIAAWEASLSYLSSALHKYKNDDVIIYDTACSSKNRMELYFQAARRNGHKILYILVDADIEKCKERGAPIDDNVFEKYRRAFSESIEALIKMSDAYVIIRNNDDLVPNVAKAIGLTRKLWS